MQILRQPISRHVTVERRRHRGNFLLSQLVNYKLTLGIHRDAVCINIRQFSVHVRRHTHVQCLPLALGGLQQPMDYLVELVLIFRLLCFSDILFVGFAVDDFQSFSGLFLAEAVLDSPNSAVNTLGGHPHIKALITRSQPTQKVFQPINCLGLHTDDPIHADGDTTANQHKRSQRVHAIRNIHIPTVNLDITDGKL